MKNPRVIIITALVGFFLSFIIALLSRAGIGTALLRAAVSAAVCAGVVAGLLFAVQNFLLKSGDEARGNMPGGARQARPGAADGERETPSAGSRVNIVLNDDALPADPDDPPFDVSGIGRSIAKLPERAVAKAMQNVPPGETFDSIPPGSQEKDASKTRTHILADRIAQLDSESPRKKAPDFAKQSDSAAGKAAETTVPRAANDAKGVPFASDGLVDLPDIGEFVTEGLSSDDEVIADTDFASATKEEVAAGRKVRIEDVDTSDSKAIAGAIRTLLVSG